MCATNELKYVSTQQSFWAGKKLCDVILGQSFFLLHSFFQNLFDAQQQQQQQHQQQQQQQYKIY